MHVLPRLAVADDPFVLFVLRVVVDLHDQAAVRVLADRADRFVIAVRGAAALALLELRRSHAARCVPGPPEALVGGDVAFGIPVLLAALQPFHLPAQLGRLPLGAFSDLQFVRHVVHLTERAVEKLRDLPAAEIRIEFSEFSDFRSAPVFAVAARDPSRFGFRLYRRDASTERAGDVFDRLRWIVHLQQSEVDVRPGFVTRIHSGSPCLVTGLSKFQWISSPRHDRAWSRSFSTIQKCFIASTSPCPLQPRPPNLKPSA